MRNNVLLFCGIAFCVAYVAVITVADAGYFNENEPQIFQYGRLLLEQSVDLLPHKALFPLDSSDVWGTIAVTLGMLIAASGGIGGGGILVPLYILMFGFRPKYAVALSNFTIVGSSITNIVLNLPKRHPSADRPLVDWDLILVMEPLTMAGAVSLSLATVSYLMILYFFVLSVYLYYSDRGRISQQSTS